jgi:hypothetical protein
MTDFQSWVDDHFFRMAAEYRGKLAYHVALFTDYCVGCDVGPEAIDVGIRSLAAVPIPVIGKYPLDVSAEEKSWYAVAPRPQWIEIRREYEQQIKQLLTAPAPDTR